MDAQSNEDAEISWVAWQSMLKPYIDKDLGRVWGQLLTTLGGYVLVVAAMVWMVLHHITYLLVLMAAIVAAGLLIRLFIFFHDACHQAFFRSGLVNAVVGYLLGTLVFTPYHAWRTEHLHHHTTVADLDRRGVGDVWTMTVAEYRAAPAMIRAAYYVFRQPLFLFTIAPAVNFVVLQRFPKRGSGRKQTLSVLATDLAILAMATWASLSIGFRNYVAVQLPIIALASSAGTWLFYVQHQFPGVYWARHAQWDPVRAALQGSSYYQLPRLLQWVSGNIGFHHVHHLSPRMPNYNLPRAYGAVPKLQEVKPITWRKSLVCGRLNLWDEERGQLVGFRSLRHAPNG